MTHLIRLPVPTHNEVSSFERVVGSRRSVREFSAKPLPLAALAGLLWAGCGISSMDGRRTVPSAGALNPLSLYAVCGNVQGAEPGVYRYAPNGHRFIQVARGDRRQEVAEAAFGQVWMASAAAILVVSAEFARTTGKYGERGIPYVYFEAGAAAQNVCLEATALGVGSAIVGAFDDEQLRAILALGDEEQPLALLPIGIRA